MIRSLLARLGDITLGTRCTHCGERRAGHRHMTRHVWLEHGDED